MHRGGLQNQRQRSRSRSRQPRARSANRAVVFEQRREEEVERAIAAPVPWPRSCSRNRCLPAPAAPAPPVDASPAKPAASSDDVDMPTVVERKPEPQQLPDAVVRQLLEPSVPRQLAPLVPGVIVAPPEMKPVEKKVASPQLALPMPLHVATQGPRDVVPCGYEAEDEATQRVSQDEVSYVAVRGSPTRIEELASERSTTTSQFERDEAALVNSSLMADLDKNTHVQATKGKAMPVPEIRFQCQLAHGSGTQIITNFNNVHQLYERIAEAFNISVDDILFCTVNTYKVNMDRLMSANLAFTDLIFAHVRGQKIEVTLTKTESALGLTISDNGVGKSFIKRIKDGSVCAKANPALVIGEHIEKINEQSMKGLRHFEVARVLRSIPVGATFTMRVIQPQQSGFSLLQPRGSGGKPQSVQDGGATLRFKASGGCVVQEAPSQLIIDRMNNVFESYLGVNDDALALTVWDIANKCADLCEMTDMIRESEVGVFDFPDELVFDMWGVVSDYRANRLLPVGTVPSE